jgi:hypothetical protein
MPSKEWHGQKVHWPLMHTQTRKLVFCYEGIWMADRIVLDPDVFNGGPSPYVPEAWKLPEDGDWNDLHLAKGCSRAWKP